MVTIVWHCRTWCPRLEAADASFLFGTGTENDTGTFVFDDDGSTYFGASGGRARLVKMDAAGVPEWTTTFDGASAMNDLARSPNGGVVAGATIGATGFMLLEVGPDGEMRWRSSWPNIAGGLFGIAANAAGFVALGQTSSPDHDFDPGPAVELPDEVTTDFITRYAFEGP